MTNPADEKRTLVVITYENKVLLGMKKRGFGKGKYNGFGGKPHEYESLLECACRETLEEANIKIFPDQTKLVGVIDFYFSSKPEWNQQVHIYKTDTYEGTPLETEEMKPEEFEIENVPYDNMWDDDKNWLPLVLEGHTVLGKVYFGEHNQVERHEIKIVEEISND